MEEVNKRADDWLRVIDTKLSGLSAPERTHARAASLQILGSWRESGEWHQRLNKHELDAIGAVVVMVEMARSLGHGATWRESLAVA